MHQVMTSPGYTTPLQTSCTPVGYSVNCFTTGGNFVPPSYMLVDQNQDARNSAFRSCLYAAGWLPAKNREEAEAITNSASTNAGSNAAPLPVSPANDRQATWDTTRANCRMPAEHGSDPFPNAFDACMRQHGF